MRRADSHFGCCQTQYYVQHTDNYHDEAPDKLMAALMISRARQQQLCETPSSLWRCAHLWRERERRYVWCYAILAEAAKLF